MNVFLWNVYVVFLVTTFFWSLICWVSSNLTKELWIFFCKPPKPCFQLRRNLVLAKMYNKHMQNMRALTFMQPTPDSMIKSEAVILSQADLSLVLVFFRSQIYCAQLCRELKVVACDLIFQQRIWALGKASLCAYLVRLPAKCPEIKWRSPGTTSACTAR